MGLISRVSSRTYRKKTTQKKSTWLTKTGLKPLPKKKPKTGANKLKILPSKNPKTNQKCSASGTSAKLNAWTWLWLITSSSTRPTLNTWPITLPGSTRPGSRKPSAILLNDLMQKGRNNGKKMLSMRIVKHAFEIIHVMTGENPVQICVSAIMNGGPREDSTRIGRAGSVRRQACDVSPM